MKTDRLRCPYCNENLAGVEHIPGLVAFGYNRATATMTGGTLPCRCGCVLVIHAGGILEYAAPDARAKPVAFVSVIERFVNRGASFAGNGDRSSGAGQGGKDDSE